MTDETLKLLPRLYEGYHFGQRNKRKFEVAKVLQNQLPSEMQNITSDGQYAWSSASTLIDLHDNLLMERYGITQRQIDSVNQLAIPIIKNYIRLRQNLHKLV
jgi:hypothetical protein